MTNFSEETKKLILSKLVEIATPKKRARELAFFKYQVTEILGTGVKPMRAVVQKVMPIFKDATPDDIIATAQALVETEIYEAQMSAIQILYSCKDRLDLETLFRLGEEWIKSDLLNNWATVDDMAKYIMGYAVMEKPELCKATYKWTKSQNYWLRRASLVTYIIPAREGMATTMVYKTAKRLMRDDEDYVSKAVGWLLRESGEKEMRRLENFVFKYGKVMRRVALRTAIEKFPEEEREFLLTQTKLNNYLEERYKNIEDLEGEIEGEEGYEEHEDMGLNDIDKE